MACPACTSSDAAFPGASAGCSAGSSASQSKSNMAIASATTLPGENKYSARSKGGRLSTTAEIPLV
eukprot:10314071-Alexandrium_andersonii.AAC.1